MSKRPTTIRLDDQLHKEVQREAKKRGLSFSSVIYLLLNAFIQGKIRIGAYQYPDEYIQQLEKESAELSRLYKKGKVKGYVSSKELFSDILGE